MRRVSAQSEIKLAYALREQIAFGRNGTSLGLVAEGTSGCAYADVPSLRLFNRTVFGPPVVRSLNVVLRGSGDDDASHLAGCLNAVFGPEVGVECVEILDITGMPRIDAFLNRLALFVLPIEGVRAHVE